MQFFYCEWRETRTSGGRQGLVEAWWPGWVRYGCKYVRGSSGTKALCCVANVPPRSWLKAQLESKELLTYCVKRLETDLKKVKLVNAEFIWTEPHSKRIKVKLKVQKEVLNGEILELSYVVEYAQQDHMCESCTRFQANPDQWVASVQLVEYDVFNVEVVSPEYNAGGCKYVIADVEVARVTNYSKLFCVRTHLGHILKPGDRALGYDLYGVNSNVSELDKYRDLVVPDVILIKKSYEEKHQKRGKSRPWKLKSLKMELNESRGRSNGEKLTSEYEEFLRNLEEDPELRFNLSLYHDKDYQASEMTSMADDDDVPSVPLEELLADLELSDEEDGGDSMRE
ncbi:hypothetical protein F3Y22_tig00110889pilonHSYRG00071 [Hibiscus syriacus]|uniref:60S ribosomal export protein NMD3 n=1 Tax=Hibiscus syriacus TaxID=106335 RepID=A0A6A2ZI32_HIBSY|nr:hypothetical protein F3Y22_tig00110889pilonHSYRG00071 [Hibiscus syriacus]